MPQTSLPGMPTAEDIRVTVEVTLWRDMKASACLAVALRTTGEDFQQLTYQLSGEHPQERLPQLFHWANLQARHIVSRVAEPFGYDLWEAIDEARMLYNHLEQ